MLFCRGPKFEATPLSSRKQWKSLAKRSRIVCYAQHAERQRHTQSDSVTHKATASLAVGQNMSSYYPSSPLFTAASCRRLPTRGNVVAVSLATTISSAPGNIDWSSSTLAFDDSPRTSSSLSVQYAGHAVKNTSVSNVGGDVSRS